MIVDVATLKEHVRIDTNAEDAYLQTMLEAVEGAVIRWCGDETRLYDTSSVVYPEVKLAILVEAARQYIQREGPQQKNHVEWFMRGYTLGEGATAILQPFRMPRIA